MAKATVEKKSKGDGGVGAFYKTGLDADGMKKELAKNRGGGGGDPELLLLYDGDQAEITFVGTMQSAVKFFQHYMGAKGGYRVCIGEDGCPYCDDGIARSERVLAAVYVHTLFKAERGQYKASRQTTGPAVGYKYFVMNKELSEALVKRAKARGGKINDRKYMVSREGGSTDTKYDLDRMDDSTDPKIIKGSKLSEVAKIQRMAAEDAKGGGSKGKGKKKKEDDYDLDKKFNDVDDDGPKKKSKDKAAAKTETKAKVSKKKK